MKLSALPDYYLPLLDDCAYTTFCLRHIPRLNRCLRQMIQMVGCQVLSKQKQASATPPHLTHTPHLDLLVTYLNPSDAT